MRRFSKITSIILLTMFLAAGPARAETIAVAVATNFLRPLQQLAILFKKQTGIKVEYSGSSTGKLYAQLRNGAPYDIFLAADAQRPELLHQDGLAEEAKVYAQGQVVLWSKDRTLTAADWQQALTSNQKRIAIASPGVAPYGEVAATALNTTGIWETIRPRLIFAQSAGQAFQYAERGATTFSFAALSYAISDAGKQGRYWSIPQAPPVVQKGCILKKSRKQQQAQRFFAFLLAPTSQKIITGYGYQ